MAQEAATFIPKDPLGRRIPPLPSALPPLAVGGRGVPPTANPTGLHPGLPLVLQPGTCPQAYVECSSNTAPGISPRCSCPQQVAAPGPVLTHSQGLPLRFPHQPDGQLPPPRTRTPERPSPSAVREVAAHGAASPHLHRLELCAQPASFPGGGDSRGGGPQLLAAEEAAGVLISPPDREPGSGAVQGRDLAIPTVPSSGQTFNGSVSNELITFCPVLGGGGRPLLFLTAAGRQIPPRPPRHPHPTHAQGWPFCFALKSIRFLAHSTKRHWREPGGALASTQPPAQAAQM